MDYFDDLTIQIETDYKNLKNSFKKYQKNMSDNKVLSELCQNYAFLSQDIKYYEKITKNIFEVERSVSGILLKDLEEIRMLLKKVKEIYIIYLDF